MVPDDDEDNDCEYLSQKFHDERIKPNWESNYFPCRQNYLLMNIEWMLIVWIDFEVWLANGYGGGFFLLPWAGYADQILLELAVKEAASQNNTQQITWSAWIQLISEVFSLCKHK